MSSTSTTGAPRSFGAFMWAYLGYVFLFDFMLAYAIYTALFQLEGLSVVEIGALLAFWSASAIVLELPSGALSDRFDRRALLVAAPLLKALTFITWASRTAISGSTGSASSFGAWARRCSPAPRRPCSTKPPKEPAARTTLRSSSAGTSPPPKPASA